MSLAEQIILPPKQLLEKGKVKMMLVMMTLITVAYAAIVGWAIAKVMK